MLPDSPFLDRVGPNALRIKGTRVGLEHLIRLYQEGLTAEELVSEFPTLSIDQVQGVMAYYLGNRDEVDEYLRSGEQRLEERYRERSQQPPSEVVAKIRSIKDAKAPR